jgi:hypothetical protein
VGEGDIFNIRFLALSVFPGKKMKSSIYFVPVISTRKHRRDRKLDHK